MLWKLEEYHPQQHKFLQLHYSGIFENKHAHCKQIGAA